MHLYQDQAFNISAILSANLDVLEVNDLNRAKLAKHNLSREQLEDRQMSADAGLECMWKGQYGVLSTQVLTDIGNASDTAAAKLNYQYFWRLTPQLSIIPNIGATWLSDDRANYYYGTLDTEVAKGVTQYRPESVVIPHVSLGASYNINANWRSSAVVTHKILPSKVSNSPLIDQAHQTSLFFGLSRSL